MSIATLIYLASLSEGFSVVFLVTAFLLLILTTALAANDEPILASLAGVFIFISLSLSAALPSEETIYMMIASSKIENSQVPEKVIKIINLKLDKVIKDNLPSHKKD